ncbi:hypothetical protein CAPTEDRAFT_223612 [Capitella teleta]|uniref:Uncharacterized protein n=1 Tax=Capitella teleta TaxID=283909 RepID=R7T335_CAPTE|nr:hypothetical protein CAPTEDRAFT_223612 [Capitella teleta]|eukprot:ELT86978.1 hypothetical protein CAPTEDRAFT_223612 [Capitella teleta]
MASFKFLQIFCSENIPVIPQKITLNLKAQIPESNLTAMDYLFSLFGFESTKSKPTPQTDGIAMETFQQRMNVNRASMGRHIQTAPDFDYMHWKQYGRHRVRINHDEDFVRQCRRLKPYVQTISDSVWLGREETRWSGLSRPEPQQPLGAGSYYGSRMASREMLSGSRELLSR